MNSWWPQRRYGLLVQTSLAAVPAWAPIGQYADWYRAHMGDQVSNTLLHNASLVETLAHHRDRWDHITEFDDFLSFLTFADFDAERWADTATAAGAGYLIVTAKHHDGWCWWDAPNSERRLTDHGPQRNVVGELAAAAQRNDLKFGVNYSLLDWGDRRHPGTEYVDQVLHPHVRDLVERYGAQVVRGDAHWGANGDYWRSDELIAAIKRKHPAVVFNDRWFASRSDFRSFEYQVPRDMIEGEWELIRGVGPGFAYNRAESAEHQLDAVGIIALLTEVVAKGGHLLICVGPDAYGQLNPREVATLRTAGEWVNAHRDLIDRATPWNRWGDESCRYMMLDGVLHAVDATGGGRFDGLGSAQAHIKSVSDMSGNQIYFEQHHDTMKLLSNRPHHPMGKHQPLAVYKIEIARPESAPLELFPTSSNEPMDLAAMLVGATSGDVIQLGDGVYQGPCRIPDGVTVRGLGADRTTIAGGDSLAVVLGVASRVEHCRLDGGGPRIAWLPRFAVRIVGNDARLLACRIEGHVAVDDVNDVKISSCLLCGIIATHCERTTIVRTTCIGMGWDCAIDIIGGAGHLVESCDLSASLQAVRMASTVGAMIRKNTISVRWWAVQLIGCQATMVIGNTVESTMRAVDVDGGSDNVVTGNAVLEGDSGCVIQRGAVNTEVSGNHWERCRIGLLCWDAGPVHAIDNHTVNLAQAAEIIGP